MVAIDKQLTIFVSPQNTLHYRRLSKKNFENVDVVNVDTLKITGRTQFVLPPSRETCNVIFSDGECLNLISTKDVSALQLSLDDTSRDVALTHFRRRCS